MSGNVKVWQVIHDGQRYCIIPNHHDTNHKVIATGLSQMEAADQSSKLNRAVAREATGNFFTGLMHISAEAAGHCVKTLKDGYEKGRK